MMVAAQGDLRRRRKPACRQYSFSADAQHQRFLPRRPQHAYWNLRLGVSVCPTAISLKGALFRIQNGANFMRERRPL